MVQFEFEVGHVEKTCIFNAEHFGEMVTGTSTCKMVSV